MKPTVLFVLCGIVFGFITPFHLPADQLEMKNGDRYVGKILSVSEDSVLLQSEVLGKVKLPRNKVSNLAFGTIAAPSKSAGNGNGASISVLTNLPDVSSVVALAKADTNLSATAANLAANPDLVRQIREQMLSGSPAAAGKYDELVNGFASGKLNMSDLRSEAKSSADQLRKLKRELGPEVGDSLDAYLEILDGFLKETANVRTPPAVQPGAPVR